MICSLLVENIDQNLASHASAYNFAKALLAKKYHLNSVCFYGDTSAYFLASGHKEAKRISKLWTSLAEKNEFDVCIYTNLKLEQEINVIDFSKLIKIMCSSDKTITFKA